MEEEKKESGFDRDDSTGAGREGSYKAFVKDKRKRIDGQGNTKVDYRPKEYTPRPGGQGDDSGKRHSYNPNFTRDNRPVGEKREYTPRDGGERRPYTPRGGEKREYTPRDGGERRPYTPRDGEKREYTPRDGSERRPYTPRDGGEKRPDTPRGEGDKPRYGDKPRFGDKPRYGDKRPYGDKPYADRHQGSRKPSFDRNKEGRGNSMPNYTADNYPTFPAPPIEDKIRLNRYISMSGICSRREADEFITSGMVTVNGETITELGTKVSATDEVRFNQNLIQNEKKVYIVMNKPKGYVTSVEDPHADKTVMELLNNGCRERVYPVGRLDKNSLGVLLITNDGDLAKKLTHPSFEKKKVYQVSLDKPLTNADMQSIADGITLDDGEVHADAISYVGDKKTEVGIEIHSGRNRIVRRIFEHLGYRVQKLDRVYFAGLTKQRLKRGAWRFLTPREVQRLLSGRYE